MELAKSALSTSATLLLGPMISESVAFSASKVGIASQLLWKVDKTAILNSPLTVSSPVPGLFKQLRIPLFGEFTCQNAILAERFIEGGSALSTGRRGDS
ncbi:PREDICTED: uncharacterized protein LOC104793172 isoform X2 [Camelina sativa]|uniref:Uncharacterized protein LOC104793172 isoform X2 n=1 Tax=Camelina sativa TaxID=90675 RepID=A0ABM1Q6E9_CAMSA|nr:PREDICTED: uncharacterized protein LOC104793172 isoform X2 [Camelina sativa]